MNVAARAELLHETAEHHGSFEALAPPHDWWDWYAAYMDARESGSTPEEASAAAGRFMAESSTSSCRPRERVFAAALEIPPAPAGLQPTHGEESL